MRMRRALPLKFEKAYNFMRIHASKGKNGFSQQMTLTEYNNEIQLYRDAVTHAWQSAENDANRATTLAASEIAAAAAIQGANIKADGDSSAAIGGFIARVLFG